MPTAALPDALASFMPTFRAAAVAAKGYSDQQRVPAGNGCGSWTALQDAVRDWLNAEVPEHDIETGERQRTQTGGRASRLPPLPGTMGVTPCSQSVPEG